jgi:hypothetical protein
MLMDERRVPGVGIYWENVALTLRVIAFLSEQEWVAKAVDAWIVRSLLGVFRCAISLAYPYVDILLHTSSLNSTFPDNHSSPYQTNYPPTLVMHPFLGS